MSTGYELEGRVRQKQRTREALVTAARELVAEGGTPTVEAAAERAGISRTTAYRYFADQAALLAAAHPETTAVSLLPNPAPSDVRERVAHVVARVTEIVRETESPQRTMLRLSLDPARQGRDDLLLRQGRVIGWLEDALEPLRATSGTDAVRSLAIAIRSAIGIESFVWLTDVAKLEPDDAVALMRWSGRAMLDEVLSGGAIPPVPSARSGSRRGR
jgi:AcrR family transcriptional regulator